MSFGFGTTGSTFGAPAAAAAPSTSGFGGFGLGATQPQQTAATSTGLFGATTAAAPATTGFGFSAPAAGTGFGAAAAAPTTAAPTTGFGGFGVAPAAAAPAAAPTSQAPQTLLASDPSAQFGTSIEARVSALKNSYLSSSPDCRFQTVFYNKVDPTTLAQYVKPPLANARLWESAVKNNPDPAALVPSLAVGFDDLRKRILEQDKAASAFTTTLASMAASLESMVHGHEASTSSALLQLQRVHAAQSHRLLQLVNRVECARSREVPRVDTEREFEHKLHVLERKMTQPQPMSQKIAELSARVKLAEQRTDVNSAAAAAAAAAANGDAAAWLQPEEPSAQQLFQFLQTQRIALEHVTALVKQDQRDLATIQKAINQTN